MARRRHSNRRRRGGGSGFLYKVLSMIVICGAIIAAMTLFFRVDTVVITGQQRYTEKEIRKAMGVQDGDNLFLMNKHEVADRMTRTMPYLDKIRINRRIPDTLLVEVKECGTPLALVQDESAWLISPSGKIVDQKPAEEASNYGIIDGCQILAPSVGTRIALATEFSAQQTGLQNLLSALDEEDMMDQVNAIHLGDLSVLSMEYGGRFTVLMNYNADFEIKMKSLRAILASDKIQDNMTGTFDMRRDDGKTNFIPDNR